MRQEVETRQHARDAVAPGPGDPVGQALAPLHVECLEADAAASHQTAWSDLCRRCLEPNVFLEPAFALPLTQHLPSTLPPRFLMVWEENGPASFGRLVGLAALRLPRAGDIARGFTHKLVALGTPLLDRDRGGHAFAAMLTWLRTAERPALALVLTDVILDQAFHATAAACVPRGVHVLDRRLRAILWRLDEGDTVSFGSAKRRKELRRQQRRLSERGIRSYTSARSTAEVSRAAERFLALELEGWKGQRGTALLADPASATFTRTMTRLMALEGKCRIDAAEIDATPVGMGIILTSGDRAFFWKTTFDESLAPLSPGVQFAFDLTEAQRADPAIAATDSCAVPDHSMINRLWRDRVAIGDVMIALDPVPSARFERALRRERSGRMLREQAKRLRRWWRHTIESRVIESRVARHDLEASDHRVAAREGRMERSRQRIDKWLWCARVAKSRTLAARLVEDGHVRVNGSRSSVPSRPVGHGDVLTIALARQVRVLRVLEVAERRGPFREASMLFEELGERVPAGG